MAEHELPTFQAEAERVAEENGLYIPVYQLNQLTRTASKAMNTIVNSLPNGTYAEFELVLELMRRHVEYGKNVRQKAR
jgi:hypothetical protein